MPPVHPRLCGEQFVDRGRHLWTGGSSPPMRGTVLKPRLAGAKHRFIPAYAGNSIQQTRALFWTPVHPRLCGEQTTPLLAELDATGSSPPMRGTGIRFWSVASCWRFIPAYAGNSAAGSGSAGLPSVHPRLCGEQSARSLLCRPLIGSSPPMRGTGPMPATTRGWRRFIPAYAGNSRAGWSWRQTSPVHPRLCGEQTPGSAKATCAGGSSPPMRGTGGHVRALYARSRFIPVYAGNRSSDQPAWHTQAVHPRLCGEQGVVVDELAHVVGSSPPMRGTDIAPWLCVRPSRFIPAYAGNSKASPAPI